MESLYRRRITIDEWERIIDARVFPENERLELIRGEILRVPPYGDRDDPPFVQRHAACLRRLNHQLHARLGLNAIVDIRCPMPIGGKHSEPEPDITLLRLREDLYSANSPALKDFLLVIEVSNSNPEYDRDVKIPLYAEAGIPESWLVDLISGTLFAYRRPGPQGYQEVRTYRRGESLAPAAFPEIRFSIDEILG